MLYVEVKTRSGRIRYHYTISTPKTDDASAIDPSLPVVLWFHGFAYPYVFQSQFADPLLRKFNLIVFSLRTHGETEADEFPEGYDVQDAADDVLAFMDALKLPACHFVALDFGTPMALQLAISHPNRVLSLFMLSQTCLEEPPNVVDAWKELYVEWGDSFLGPNEVDAERMHDSGYGFADYMFSNHLTNLGQAMSDISHPLAARHWGWHGKTNWRIGFLEFLLNRKPQPIEALSRIRCPVKLVYGTNDIAYSQEYTENFLHDLRRAGVTASMYIVDGAPHFLNVDFADEVNPLIHDFILQNDSRRVPPVEKKILSPWDKMFREKGWDPEGLNVDPYDEEFVITYPAPKS